MNDSYLLRINRVIDYIYDHVDDELRLDTLARVACFSPYHFHRIFKALVGENLNEFVKRARLERAALLLRASPSRHLTDVAFECGFSSLSDFSRSFKKHFGISPRQWDRRGPLKNSKICQAGDSTERYTLAAACETDEGQEFSVTIKRLPAQRIAYVRILNYEEGGLVEGYERLVRWVRDRFGAQPPGQLIGLFYDDPEVTPAGKCRYDMCVTVPGDVVEGRGGINVRTLPACDVASLRCVGDEWTVFRAWEYLYRQWLPRSRYQPLNLPAMEVFVKIPDILKWNEFDLECCLPIQFL
jgi:AraC family transcriptional regulator